MKEKSKSIIIIILNVAVILMNIGGLLWIRKILNLAYPHLYPSVYLGKYCIVPLSVLTVLIVPTCIIILIHILFRMGYLGGGGLLGISISLLTAVLFVLGMGFIILNLFPPSCSKTNDINNYLQVDETIKQYSSCYDTFMPSKIPDTAVDIKYLYSEYEAFFSQEFTIKASWILPDTEYEQTIKKLQKNNFTHNYNIDRKESVFLISEMDKSRHTPEMTATFSDSECRVTYYVHLERDL